VVVVGVGGEWVRGERELITNSYSVKEEKGRRPGRGHVFFKGEEEDTCQRCFKRPTITTLSAYKP
jgi:hypothetical protein